MSEDRGTALPAASSSVAGAVSRRRVLGTAGAAGLLGLAGVIGACGNSPTPSGPAQPGTGPSGSAPPTSTTAAATYSGDLRDVALCAALANLVASLYSDAVTAAGQGRYGPVPGAVTALLSGASGQHTAAAAAWNQVLTTAGRPEVTGTPLTVEPSYRARWRAAVAPLDLLALTLDLETTVGATLVVVLGEITDPSAVSVGASVAPVAAMHATTASFLLGRLPTPPADPAAGALGRDTLQA